MSFNIFDVIGAVILIVVASIASALYLWWMRGAISKRPLTGAESLLGKTGIARTDLSTKEDGEVTVEGITWKARQIPEEGTSLVISKGEPVVVVKVSSLTLFVKRPESA